MPTAPTSRMPATTSPPSKPLVPRWFEWPWQTVPRAEALFKLARMTRVQGMGLDGNIGPPRYV